MLGLRRSTSSASSTRRSPTRATATLHRNIIFNGILYPVSLPVDERNEVEGVPVRLRVGFRLSRPRVRGTAARDEVHRRPGDADQRVRHRVRSRARADPGDRRHRPRLPRPQHLDHRRVHASSKCPDVGEDFDGQYYDFDLYGTVNFTDYVGAQVGYRSFNVYYKVDQDEGTAAAEGVLFRRRRAVLILSEGLRPSDSLTRSLARRFAGSLRSRGLANSSTERVGLESSEGPETPRKRESRFEGRCRWPEAGR